ncbi:MAG TPA: exopolyphosphatase [Arenimonas sp.]|nr:exopolyphosphatase [Arenimonas sp.]
MPSDSRQPLQDGELLAAVDIGSNSFHMVVARYVLGHLRIVDRIKEPVRLAEGLDGQGGLGEAALARALDCLSRFGQRLRPLQPERVRAIATNTVRQLREPQSFLLPAETALGHAIDVVAGREEARLIYLGVAHGNPPRGKRRLVMDVGGGSTEFIVGDSYEPLERESLQMGCIATTRRFFGDGTLSRKRWKDARTELAAELQQFAATYKARGWKESLGASGTIKAVGEIALAMKLSKGAVTDVALNGIRERLLDFARVEDIKLPGLSSERRPVIAGGLLILDAAFAELDIKRMIVSDYALREGVLYDLVGRASERDPREASIEAYGQRYGIDSEQAASVEATALRLFDQARPEWELDEDDRRLLGWAARLHEIGLTIAHSQYHQHGAYILEHSDIAGFARSEQLFLAALVRNHRRSLATAIYDKLPDRLMTIALRCTLLLRLAVLLHRSHEREAPPQPELAVDGNTMTLKLPKSWLAARPLTREDLETEREYLLDVDYRLVVRGV